MFLKLRNDRLLKDVPVTYLNEYVSAGEMTLPVVSNNGFSGSNYFLLLEDFGNETAEIVTFSSSVDSDLISCGVTKFDHAQGCPVYLINADRVIFYYSNLLTGTFTSLPTATPAVDSIAIAADEQFTYLEDTGRSTGFGKAAFYNSLTHTQYGSFYEIIKYNTEDRVTRGFVKGLSLKRMNAEVGAEITEDFLNEVVTECDLRLRDEKISWQEEASQLVVTPEPGITTYDVSSYIKDDNTISSIQHVMINGSEALAVTKDLYEERIGQAVRTILLAPITVAGEEAILSNSNDFADSGTVFIAGQEISYTENDRANNRLKGCSGYSQTINNTTDNGHAAEVWQNAELGVPEIVTVIGGQLMIYPVPDTAQNAKTVQLDYTKTFNPITSDSDELAFPAFLYVDFLKAAISEKRGDKDAERLMQRYDRDVIKHKSKDFSAVETKFVPRQQIYSRRRR